MEVIDGIKLSDGIETGGISIREAVKLINQWNEFAAERNLPRITKLTKERYVNICRRFEDPAFIFEDILVAIDEQPMLLGQNRRQWKVNFDYLTRDPKNKSTYVKVLERGFI